MLTTYPNALQSFRLDARKYKFVRHCTTSDLYLVSPELRNAPNPVAVKMFRGCSLTMSPGQKQTFINELGNYAEQWSQAGHDHVVPLLGTDDECADLPALRLPYYENGNIMDFKENNAAYSEQIQRKLMCQVALALNSLHSQGMFHGSLRASKILIDDDGNARLGYPMLCAISRKNRQSTDNNWRWRDTRLIELEAQTDQPIVISDKTDVFGYAMTLIEICSGNVPYASYRDCASIVAQILNGRLEPLTKPPMMDERLWEIVQECRLPEQSRPKMSTVVRWMQEYATR
ncbi:kinase-like protein [Rickenella mellea]|uniref:Kinase-like protein n=1 Tax=Rickenella mellea TaxID=50990 RepID=A0A4Y7Q8K7_9AGAM|nr:kinase-like protein [Rickenella mellea]